MYTIGQVSKKFNIPISTLRYYDKEGLLPNLKRNSGIRYFNENDLEILRVIECLKKSGLEIKKIKQFIEWCKIGDETINKRKELFESQRTKVIQEINNLNNVLKTLEFKLWYYTESSKDGTEERVKSLIPNDLPDHIKELYELSHK